MRFLTSFNFRSVHSRTVLSASIAALLGSALSARAGNTWDGLGADDNWGTPNNWNPDGAPAYGTLTFSGSTRTTNINNSITSMNIVMWAGGSAWTMNNSGGTVLSLFDFSGGQAKVENQSSGLVTINAPITFAANNGPTPPNPFGEINAVNGNITFGSGTLTVNGSSVNGIKMFGGGRTTTFNNTVSASGKWFGTTAANTTAAVGGAFTSGDIYVMNGGTLKLNSGGTITTSALRLGGDFGNTGNQNQALGGTFQLTNSSGGQSFAGVINTVTGNTSNALLIDSQNTSNTNTLSGGIFLDADLKTQTAGGGTLSYSGGTFDVKIRKLTVSGTGTTNIGEVLSSSFAAGGFVVKEGAGTLVLQNTANTYTGTNAATLNANGTQINAGTLGIHGDASLGLAPSGAYNNIQFTGSGTLQDTANNISLNANRNLSVTSGATATLDSNGNTFTVNGVINGGGGNLAKTGGGTVALTGANSFTGTTSVNQGALQAGVGTLTTTTGISVNLGGTLLLAGTGDHLKNTSDLTLAGGTFDLGGVSEGSVAADGLGALILSSNSFLSFGAGDNLNLLRFGSVGAHTAGAKLTITNWDGNPYVGNGDERLLFTGTVSAFKKVFASPDISFNGIEGYEAVQFSGYFEIVAVPEPATIFGALGLVGLIGWRERRRILGRV